jgi:hypothetical protein
MINTSKAWDWPAAAPLQRGALVVGGVGLAACLLGAFLRPAQFFHSWLFAFISLLAFPLGSLALLMLHHLTGGAWGVAIRRTLEAASRTLPLALVMFLPLLVGLTDNYSWARHDGAADAADEHRYAAQEMYYQLPFFLGRAAACFAAWMILVFLFSRWSAEEDRTGDKASAIRARHASGVGLAIYGLTVTVASIDWIMSLDGHWSSTIFGPIVASSQMLPALALAVVAATFLAEKPPLAAMSGPRLWGDLGNLLLAFVMLWTYMAFSQFLLMWAGNLPEEITWYQRRSEGGWVIVVVLLAICAFALPFCFLLLRDVKRNPARLRGVALAILAMSFVHEYWLIAPAFSETLTIDWLDVAALAGGGGLWLAMFLWQLQTAPVLPLNLEIHVEEALHHA